MRDIFLGAQNDKPPSYRRSWSQFSYVPYTTPSPTNTRRNSTSNLDVPPTPPPQRKESLKRNDSARQSVSFRRCLLELQSKVQFQDKERERQDEIRASEGLSEDSSTTMASLYPYATYASFPSESLRKLVTEGTDYDIPLYDDDHDKLSSSFRSSSSAVNANDETWHLAQLDFIYDDDHPRTTTTKKPKSHRKSNKSRRSLSKRSITDSDFDDVSSVSCEMTASARDFSVNSTRSLFNDESSVASSRHTGIGDPSKSKKKPKTKKNKKREVDGSGGSVRPPRRPKSLRKHKSCRKNIAKDGELDAYPPLKYATRSSPSTKEEEDDDQPSSLRRIQSCTPKMSSQPSLLPSKVNNSNTSEKITMIKRLTSLPPKPPTDRFAGSNHNSPTIRERITNLSRLFYFKEQASVGQASSSVKRGRPKLIRQKSSKFLTVADDNVRRRF